MATNNKMSNKPAGRRAVTKAFESQNHQSKSSLSQEQLQEAIRLKAYELYAQRGCMDGDHENDWLAAERIVLGSS